MNNQPQIRVPGFPAIELNSSVAIDRAAPEQLLWKADEIGRASCRERV